MSAQTLNIRGASLTLVASTTATSGTSIATLVAIESLPGAEATRRNVTELTHTTSAHRMGRLKSLTGELAYTVHMKDDAGHTDRTGTNGILLLRLPADPVGTATTHKEVRMYLDGGFMGDEALPGSDEEDVKRRIRFALNVAATVATATTS